MEKRLSTIRVAESGSAQKLRDARKSGRPGEKDGRTPSRRDRDKILYASSVQRLTGVTQVVTPEPGGALTHNRLTHSLKVAQVARSIAEALLIDEDNHEKLAALGGLDADVTEAVGLGHDIGHPPFGHVGETVLDDFARGELNLAEGFEGNAQTFRIACRLDTRSPTYDGMDLTAATRCGLLKYPWARQVKDLGEHKNRLENDPTYRLHWQKFGYYDEETTDFEEARSIPGVTEELQSIEAAIMDLADDVTYALHDLQDFYMARVLPVPALSSQLDAYLRLEQSRKSDNASSSEAAVFATLARKLRRDYPDRFNHDAFTNAVRDVAGEVRLSFLDYFDASPDSVAIVTRSVSNKIGELTNDLKINMSPTGQTPVVHLSGQHWHEVQVLKHLTSVQVIGRADMAVYQRAQQAVLLSLLRTMKQWSEDNNDSKRLPQPLQQWRTAARDEGRDPARCLIDFVANLSDHQALSLHKALQGGGSGLVTSLIL